MLDAAFLLITMSDFVSWSTVKKLVAYFYLIPVLWSFVSLWQGNLHSAYDAESTYCPYNCHAKPGCDHNGSSYTCTCFHATEEGHCLHQVFNPNRLQYQRLACLIVYVCLLWVAYGVIKLFSFSNEVSCRDSYGLRIRYYAFRLAYIAGQFLIIHNAYQYLLHKSIDCHIGYRVQQTKCDNEHIALFTDSIKSASRHVIGGTIIMSLYTSVIAGILYAVYLVVGFLWKISKAYFI